MNRRAFSKLLGALAVAPLARRVSAESLSDAIPRIGVQTSISKAPDVRNAGGDFIAESVVDFIIPEAPDGEYQRNLERLRAAPCGIYSCNSFIRREDLHCTGPRANHDTVCKYAEVVFERAARANIRIITFGSSNTRKLPAGFSETKGKDQFVEVLARMAPLAARHGIIVSVESLRSQECNFLTRIGEVAEVVRRVNHPAVRATADFYHMAYENETPDDLAAVVDVLAHVEIAEKEGRRIPGTTAQDFRPFFRVLKTSKYQGALCFEGNFKDQELAPGLAAMRQQWTTA
ncbi:MAG TPA: sugar phosphate isomerase/epimerase family protein [Opitutaceae bacterium]|nr:sugar phosphate isomerase/epimerase family protein [Opitutaceae bacterium]